VEVWQTSNLQRLRLGEEKKEERRRKNKPQHENIMVCAIPYGDHNEHSRTSYAEHSNIPLALLITLIRFCAGLLVVSY